MKINPDKLAESIDSMGSICSRGKRDIRKLFEDGFGIEFEPLINRDLQVESGDRFMHKKHEVYIVVESSPYNYSLICLKTGQRWQNPVYVEGQSILLSKLIGITSNVKDWVKKP